MSFNVAHGAVNKVSNVLSQERLNNEMNLVIENSIQGGNKIC